MAKIHVHFLGIGGSGASAAAAIAQTQGYKVSGCDLQPDNEFTTPFKKSQLFKGHSPDHLNQKSYEIPQVSIQIHTRSVHSNIDILAVTPAIYSLDPNNPELLAAKKMGIEILTWQQFLGKYLTKDKFVIAVSGTHGKTTTTAMIAKLLVDANLDPTIILGAIVPEWGTNHRIPLQIANGRRYFVIEADEFNDNFLSIIPDISVVTNIEMDHPEYFKDFADYKNSFKKFLLQTRSAIIANLSDPVVDNILNGHTRSVRSIIDYSKKPIDFPLKVPGEFNKLNTKAAFQVGLLLGIDPQVIQKSLASFAGASRRFEYLGNYKGRIVYSDFGHHPTEIKVTMEATREKFPNQRIILIYEPHMFSRTKALFDDFVKVFKSLPVDKIIITDVYPSREVDTGIVSSQQLVDAVGYDTLVYHSKNQLLPMLKHHIKDGDIIFFMGAGDIDQMARSLVS